MLETLTVLVVVLAAIAAGLGNAVWKLWADRKRLKVAVQVQSSAIDKLHRIVQTAATLATEKHLDVLCQRILEVAKEVGDADGGTLYLLSPDHQRLDFTIVLNDSLGTHLGGTSGKDPKMSVPLFTADGKPNHHFVSAHAFHAVTTINIADAYTDSRFDFTGTRKFDSANHYRSKSFLTVPLTPLGGAALGALQLINCKTADKFSNETQQLVEALTAAAATAIYSNQLLTGTEKLLDATIDMINTALGRKSPYTGGHCERVPIVAMMIADAAPLSTGALKNFRFASDDARREFVLSAKLHDIGKITTPEYVVDKSTKLETVYNRIHEVRMRFEVLYRDALIAMLQKNTTKLPKAAKVEAVLKQLQEEYAFVARMNLGGEVMTAADRKSLERLAKRPWTRYFDDSLGLGPAERERRTRAKPLPASERLLIDRKHHKVPRHKDFSTQYAGKGFVVPPPEYEYDHGELYNLLIERGTLTPEEHFKIKDHVMQTISMLETLPLPERFQRVPEIAGEHHETLKGTGYPRGLGATSLTTEARILAVADIFEALTASDRPYKTPHKLSGALGILAKMRDQGLLDADVLELLVTSGVYREYAKQYLKPEQIDKVDESQFISAPKSNSKSPAPG